MDRVFVFRLSFRRPGLDPTSIDRLLAADDLCGQCLRYISENGHERIQVDDVVFPSGTNRRTLERKFRLPWDAVLRKKFPVADRTVEEADDGNRRFFKSLAVDLGFRNADHFARFSADSKNNSIPIPKEGKEERPSRFRNSGRLQIGRGPISLEHRPTSFLISEVWS